MYMYSFDIPPFWTFALVHMEQKSFSYSKSVIQWLFCPSTDSEFTISLFSLDDFSFLFDIRYSFIQALQMSRRLMDNL